MPADPPSRPRHAPAPRDAPASREAAAGSGALVARRCLVSGRVQGVFYRGSARERARAAGIAGHARNLPDGRVEVLVYGPELAVRGFIEWLWIGPTAAKVLAVEVEELPLPRAGLPRDFTTA